MSDFIPFNGADLVAMLRSANVKLNAYRRPLEGHELTLWHRGNDHMYVIEINGFVYGQYICSEMAAKEYNEFCQADADLISVVLKTAHRKEASGRG